MHARRGERYGDRKRDVWRELRDAGFSPDLVKASVRMMTKLVEGLTSDLPEGVWTEYGRVNTYTDADAEAKGAFVRAATGARRGAHRWSGTSAATMGYARVAAAEGAAWSRWTPTRGRSSCSTATCAPRAAFGRCLGDAFEVERSASLASGTRLLYLAHLRGRSAAA